MNSFHAKLLDGRDADTGHGDRTEADVHPANMMQAEGTSPPSSSRTYPSSHAIVGDLSLEASPALGPLPAGSGLDLSCATVLWADDSAAPGSSCPATSCATALDESRSPALAVEAKISDGAVTVAGSPAGQGASTGAPASDDASMAHASASVPFCGFDVQGAGAQRQAPVTPVMCPQSLALDPGEASRDADEFHTPEIVPQTSEQDISAISRAGSTAVIPQAPHTRCMSFCTCYDVMI
jgi:hypothetical protein